MKRFSVIACALLFTLGAFSASYAGSGAFQGLKVGGGILWNDRVNAPLASTGGSFHVSADFGLMRPISLTPFYEYARRNGISTTLAGGELHYDIPVAQKGTFYFGPGFGVADAGGTTKFHVNGVGGFRYNLAEHAGLFIQGKYAWAAGRLLNGATVHGGLVFSLKGLMKTK